MKIYLLLYYFLYLEFSSCNYTLYIYYPLLERKLIGPEKLFINLNESSLDWNNDPELLKICRIICIYENLEYEDIVKLKSNPQNIIWNLFLVGIIRSDIFYGPFPVPNKYIDFPGETYELKWYSYLYYINGYVVQTKRVRNHLMKRSNTYSLLNKYIIVPNCIKYKPISNSINEWNERMYDIILYLKYEDLNKSNEGNILYNELSKEYKIKLIKYGNYKMNEIYKYGNQCKFVLYFSFYDINPAALMEIQNMGVFAITLQEELIDENNGIYIPELETNLTEAIIKIRKITQNKYDSVYLSNYNRKKHDCINSFKMFLNQVIK